MTGLGKQLPHDGDAPDVVLDVTGDVCPMTFVRTRLRLDQMAPGQVLEVRFRGAEPRENLPRSLRDLGQELLAAEEGWLRVRKR
jgi:TusA-related sulfurtransferase